MQTNFNKISNFLNLAGSIILLLIIVNLSMKALDVLYIKKSSININRQKDPTILNNSYKYSNKNVLPDIYYIVLDSYPNHEYMRDILSFNNDDFITHLKTKNFFITKKSRCNYNYTRFSMFATFDLNYLPMEKIEKDIFKFKKNEIYFKKIENSKTIYYFKSLGYNIYIDSPVAGNDYFDIEFNLKLSYMTVLGLPYMQSYVSSLFFRNHVLLTLKKLENPINNGKPIFVYGHVMLPHFPYMFDRYGNLPNYFRSNVQQLFTEQLLYTNTRLKSIIGSILSNKKRKSIIIIQGDHGPDRLVEDKTMNMRLRTSMLCAVYLPDAKENIFYDGMTSVNTFRIVFNKYFGANFELLPDITYYQENERGNLIIYNPN